MTIEQVGGDHYAADYQHWDWVVDCHIPYLPAAASKYVTRARKKNGAEDLQKALTFIQRAEEGQKMAARETQGADSKTTYAGDYYPGEIISMYRDRLFWRFAHANGLNTAEAAACWSLMVADWEAARAWVNALLQSV